MREVIWFPCLFTEPNPLYNHIHSVSDIILLCALNGKCTENIFQDSSMKVDVIYILGRMTFMAPKHNIAPDLWLIYEFYDPCG